MQKNTFFFLCLGVIWVGDMQASLTRLSQLVVNYSKPMVDKAVQVSKKAQQSLLLQAEESGLADQARLLAIKAQNITGSAKQVLTERMAQMKDKFNSVEINQDSKSMHAPKALFSAKSEANITNNFYGRTTYWDLLEKTGTKGIALFTGFCGTIVGWTAHAVVVKPSEKVIVVQVPATLN